MVLLPCCELPLAESHVGGRCDTDGVAEPMQIRLGCCSYDPTVALLNQNDVLRQGRISGESECVLVFAQGYTLCLHKCNSYLRMLCTEEQREQRVSAYACTSERKNCEMWCLLFCTSIPLAVAGAPAGSRAHDPAPVLHCYAQRTRGSERVMLLLRRLGLAGAGRRRRPAARGLASGAPREAADAVVVGAGVVGLAVARALAMAGREVVVVEAAPSFGTGTSSRNSEVIHAGIYYPPRSLKASLCVRGKEMLYKYCAERGVAHKQLGKLIVATGAAETGKLDMLLRNAKQNGVNDLQLIEGSQAMEMEPELRCLKALLSPSTGIVDSHSFMLSLLGDAENLGTTISYNTAVIGGHVGYEGLELHICESKELQNHPGGSHASPQLVLLPRLLINSAGLSAIPLAKRLYGLDQAFVPNPHYARGCYFTLSQTKSPFSHLIYPLPEDGGIGVHVTIDLNGLVRFGPDVEWLDGGEDPVSCFLNRFDYSVNPTRCSVFYPVVRKYFPNLKDGSLEPGYSGIRPKLSGPGQPPSDFVIQGQDIHGIPGLVNLFGIESPGLTSSLAIAEHIVSRYS